MGAIISGKHNDRGALLIQFNPAGLAFRRWARKKPPNGGFGVEYALYMMDLTDVYNIGNTGKTTLSPDAFEPETVTPKP
jgi:hypothetical protein